VLAVTPRPPWNGSDRIRTGTLSPDKRALSALSYAPKLRRWDSNPRSRAHEAREDGRSSTALGLAGRTRTCDLRFPKPVGCQTPLRPVEEPPAGLEPAASGLRIRRHPVSTTGAREAPAAGIEPAISRVTTARLTDSTTPERTETAGLEPARRQAALRRSKALPSQTRPCLQRKERESNPQGPSRPTRFRNGIPRLWQSFPMAPAGVEPATSRLRVGRSAELSYGAVMPCSRFPGARRGQSPEPAREARVAGRDRTCGAPRFRRALYRLSYGHEK
jgi:hypothetical protein